MKTDGAFGGSVFWEFAEGKDNLDFIVVTDEEAWHGYKIEFLPPSVQLLRQAYGLKKADLHLCPTVMGRHAIRTPSFCHGWLPGQLSGA